MFSLCDVVFLYMLCFSGADAEARVYPGGAFDPLGFSKVSA